MEDGRIAKDLLCGAGEKLLKGHCIEFKYYADGIHSGLTPPGNNSWPAGVTKAEISPSLFTPLSPSLFTPHQILYSAPLRGHVDVHTFRDVCKRGLKSVDIDVERLGDLATGRNK